MRRAFTILELLVVIAIVAILGAIVSRGPLRARAQGRLTACKSNLKNIGTALEMYASDNGGRYPTTSRLLTPNYLKTIPTCSSVGSQTYVIATGSEPDLYTVVCRACSFQYEPGYPQYTSVTGLIERP